MQATIAKPPALLSKLAQLPPKLGLIIPLRPVQYN